MPKRRAPVAEDEENDGQSPTQRRRLSEADDDTSYGDDAEEATQGDSNREQMVKNLVRLALACEYTRAPLRRSDITTKVLGQHTRQFKDVFAAAQQQLEAVFGMQLIELPVRDKVTVQQRKAAAQAEAQAEARRIEAEAKRAEKEAKRKNPGRGGPSQGQTPSAQKSNVWILTTTLPEKYRTPDILPPPATPTAESESQYVALSSFVTSVIMLSGGTLAEAKLDRYMTRANVGETTPFSNSIAFIALDKTEKLLKKMEKDGFIVRVRDTSSGDETIEYILGPRGKIEIGTQGVEGLVKEVYGETDDPEDLDKRLRRSLQMASMAGAEHTQVSA